MNCPRCASSDIGGPITGAGSKRTLMRCNSCRRAFDPDEWAVMVAAAALSHGFHGRI
jgi:hypothetical protein